jgi:hypothetical protein
MYELCISELLTIQAQGSDRPVELVVGVRDHAIKMVSGYRRPLRVYSISLGETVLILTFFLFTY